MSEKNVLPQGWENIKLGDITQPSKEKVNPLEISDIRYIGLEHIEKETGRLLGYGSSGDIRSTKSVFRSGDLLYGKLRPYLNKVYVPDFEGICSTDILVFPKNSTTDNRFLYYRFLSSDFVRFANQNVSGVQHPRVSAKTLAEFEINVPPLPEQERIVAKIEELFTQLDAGVAELEQAKAQLKRYRQSVLKSAVEGELTREWRESKQGELEPASQLLERILAERREKWKVESGKKKYKEPAAPDVEGLPDLPDGWVWASVAQIAEHRLGKMLDKAKNKGKPTPYLRNINVRWFEFDLSDIQLMKVTDNELKEVSIREGDLVICEGGEPGRSAVWNKKDETFVIQKALHRVRPAQGVLSKYINYLLAKDAWTGFLKKYFTGSTIMHFTGRALSTYAVPLPPAIEQQRIVEMVERRLSVADEIEKELDQALVRAERLRQSVLKSAFEGRLV